MSGQMMKCNTYENRKMVEQYVEAFSPYESRPSIGIDLVALTRYAKQNGKRTDELSEQEIARFKK